MADCGGNAQLVKVKAQILINEHNGFVVVSIQNTLHQFTKKFKHNVFDHQCNYDVHKYLYVM